MTLFDWDKKKNEANHKKHGIRFEEAETVWLDPHSSEYFDVLHSVGEDRYVKIGMADSGRILTIIFTEKLGQIRIISARKATALERIRHEEGI